MALKQLLKKSVQTTDQDKKAEAFILKGGTAAEPSKPAERNRDHEEIRFVFRVPKWIIKMIDLQRKDSVEKVSRNSFMVKMLADSIKKNY